jgi:hypothetical protein
MKLSNEIKFPCLRRENILWGGRTGTIDGAASGLVVWGFIDNLIVIIVILKGTHVSRLQ